MICRIAVNITIMLGDNTTAFTVAGIAVNTGIRSAVCHAADTAFTDKCEAADFLILLYTAGKAQIDG